MGLSGSKTPDARVLLLGLDAAGKSTLLYKLKYKERFSTVPTVGFNVEMVDGKKNRRKIALTIWDVGGQEKMRLHWRNFYQDAAGMMFVVDCSDRRRLEQARKVLERVLRHEHLRGLPVLVFANKQDVTGALTATELTETFKLRKICSERDWFVQPCSAVTGAGLEEGFRRMVQLVKITSEDTVKDTVKYLKNKSAKSMKM
ncbi:ADP-ribosylation factor-like protein 14 [Denticeps clupeoides]|uniref:ADP-ribosylation factor-like protein 14 n=1 Tax=Denticeps clupeoides TaxID=299321 RepID=UPI0010A51A19|nr:ADP-ribosylation factor-like protein 14 [Denticeps clupeoides]